MIILGFDPGLATLGYGIISTDGHKHRAVDFGIISTPAGMNTPVRPVSYTHLDVYKRQWQGC